MALDPARGPAAITSRNCVVPLSEIRVKARPRGQGVLIYGVSAARNNSQGRPTEFTGYLVINDGALLRQLIADLRQKHEELYE